MFSLQTSGIKSSLAQYIQYWSLYIVPQNLDDSNPHKKIDSESGSSEFSTNASNISQAKAFDSRRYLRLFSSRKLFLLLLGLCTLTGIIMKWSGCSPVSLHLKVWGVELQMNKGECPSFPQLPQ